MSSQEKESYKDYLVRTVTQEIGNIFNQKMDEAKRELKNINYKLALENTEEILKNYKKLRGCKRIPIFLGQRISKQKTSEFLYKKLFNFVLVKFLFER